MNKYALVVFLSASTFGLKAQSVTHEQACGQRFFPAVIPIETERELGTGFIVSSDGWIVTASHVVIDPDTRQADKSIMVTLQSGKVVAHLMSANDDYTRIHDFAFLKVDVKDLPFLALGDENKVIVGSDLTIVGFPFSATQRIPIRFCLAATTASWFNNPTPIGAFTLIFFQGPSIKGISGSPVISNTTGTVVGMADASLAGISQSLRAEKAKADAFRANGGGMSVGGVNFIGTISGIIDVLDNQLANGLGVATGAKDIGVKLAEAQKQDAANTAK